jgi:hypothetical protein
MKDSPLRCGHSIWLDQASIVNLDAKNCNILDFIEENKLAKIVKIIISEVIFVLQKRYNML